MKMNPEYVAYVGIDWADRIHQVCVRALDSARDEQMALKNEATALHAWACELRARFPQGKIAVALEQSRGSLIYALSMHEHLALFPVNPAMLSRYRAAAKSSGAKNDPLDAALLCELMRVHRDWLRPLPAVPAPVRELQMLLEARRGLVDQRTSVTNQLGAVLKGYFPQARQLVSKELGTPLACAFLRRWPTLAAVQRARPETLRRFYRAHGVHDEEVITERLAVVRTAVPLTNDAAVLATAPVLLTVLVAQLEVLQPAIADYDGRIAALFATQQDYALFEALPGAGEQLAPRLLVAFGPDRSRYTAAQQLQQYSGIAPVQEKSGNTCVTLWRWHAPTFLRQTFHEFAGCSIPNCRWAKAYYEQQIDRGNTHHQAIRALAYKWQRVLFRCWQEHEPYDDARYISALRRHGSPLVARIDQLTADAA